MIKLLEMVKQLNTIYKLIYDKCELTKLIILKMYILFFLFLKKRGIISKYKVTTNFSKFKPDGHPLRFDILYNSTAPGHIQQLYELLGKLIDML